MDPIQYVPQNQDFGSGLADAIRLAVGVNQLRSVNAQQEQADQYRTDLQAALKSNDPHQLMALAVKYPQQGAGLKTAWEGLQKQQRDSEFNGARDVFYSINSGRPDVALGVIDQHIAAMSNAGQDASKLKQLRAAVERDPKGASQNVGLFLASVAPKEFGETLAKLGTERRADEVQPAAVARSTAEARKVASEADTAAVTARFADSKAAQDLAKGGWDIKKIQNDIEVAKQNVKIAAANVAIGKEANSIKREGLQLQRDKFVQERDNMLRTKVADVEAARGTIDNFLNTADRIIAVPLSVKKAAMGPVYSRLPTMQQDVADFESLHENIGAQAFLSQLPSMKGLGSLSNAEGEQLRAALQSLSLRQSPEQFDKNIREAQRIIIKARNNLATRYGVPNNTPDTPAAAAATPANDIDALVKKYGG